MKEKKVRQKGFLALLLATIIVLGMPGMTVFANSYDFNNISNGTILSGGDHVYLYDSSGSGDLGVYIGTSNSNTVMDYDFAAYYLSVTISNGYWIVTDKSASNDYNKLFVSPTSAPPVLPPSNPSSSLLSIPLSPSEGYYQSIRELIALIKLPGGDTHRFSTGTALTYDILKSLEDNPEDTFIFTTEYKGYRYTYTIHGYDVKGKIKPEIPWYGPYWLAQNFFETTVIEPLEPITPIQ